ncbi:MAG: sigma-70 family RNA polymerase sigma factor [Thermoanaerobaculia bacterium]
MGSFPVTRLSVVEALGERDPERRREAWDLLLRSYDAPLRSYLSRRWRTTREETEDLAQGFLARALESGAFDAFDPAQARFRTFLRLCLDRYVLNEREAAGRAKRGGGAVHVTIAAGDGLHDGAVEPPAPGADPEELFHREWLRAIFGEALEELAASAATPERRLRLALFERYELGAAAAGEGGERPTYAELAAELGVPVTRVTNHLARARRDLRRLVLERIRRATVSESEFRDEARRALGVEQP